MQNETSIEVLNTLIKINNDRIDGYKTAAKETEEEDLKSLFSKLGRTSQKCKTELVTEVVRLGGTPDKGTKTTGKFFRVWMDVKAALTGKDRKAILDSCEYGEDVAVDTYNKAMINHPKDLNIDQQKMIGEQCRMIKADHDKVKEMREALAELAE
jgi:uncharacterized protein (TIGR02284 family)